MAIFTVGPNSTFPSIAAAMAAAGPGDTIQLEAGYSNETATVTHSGMIITGEASSVGIVLQLGSGIATVTLAGAAPINLIDASDGNSIIGNDGNNHVTVTAGADSVSGGLGEDRLFVDYRLATGAVTGDSTSNVAEAGGGGRLVTINGGFEHFTIWTGSGADTITTGAGDDDIRTGEGAGTVTAGEGANYIVGGGGADTITAGGGGNYVDGGNGANTITTGGGVDLILTGRDMDTIVAGGGNDTITAVGGADTIDSGAGSDHLIVDYSAAATNVTGGVTGGNLASGYTGHIADLASATLDFVETERFWITTGTGNDSIVTGAADDRITTGTGNDVLDGGGGTDLLTGGGGDDLYHVDNAADLVVEASGGGNDRILASVSYQLGGNSFVETLEAAAGTAPLSLTGNYLANNVIGNAGANVLHGGGGAGDVLAGMGGNDVYYSDVAGTRIVEAIGGGNDALYTSVSYVLAGDAEVETLSTNSWAATNAINLTGNGFNQIIVGNAGANVLHGGGGTDTLYGFGGNDTYYTDVAATQVVESAGGGNDALYTSVSYTLAAAAEVELLSTNSHAATVAIDLTGNGFANTLAGNAGANVLDGKAGNDWLYGYGGADSFAFTAVLGAGNVDNVADFQAGIDRFLLDDSVFAGLAPGALTAGAFVTGSAAADADDRIIYNQSTGALLFDADGNGAGAAVQFATLYGAPVLTAADFFVI
jgi:serralysin